MRNRYAGACRDCRCHVPAGGGFFERNRTLHKWDVRCVKCVAEGRERKGKSLSLAQKEALKHEEAR
jgi:hypothetical protein